jgi:predicted Ser/Thr protein kinase
MVSEKVPNGEPPLCPDCGQVLPPGRLEGNCPHCLLRLVVPQSPEASPAPASGVRPPVSAPGVIRYLGDYEPISEIARGGMGVVFRARQCSLNRLVAVKLLPLGPFAKESNRRRFRQEAAAAARLQHPNILSIYEAGEHEGQPYFSMELIEGRNLAALTREKPCPPRQAAAWISSIAEAVHYAHQRGVLHRDLKPSDVLVDAAGQPHVTDFGLARLDGDSELTVSGEVLGTPGFMSPEQAGGQRGAVSAASDVYSLGALLYHTLSGRPPFLANTPEATLRQVMENEPVSPRLLNAAVPRDLETICLKCLGKDPARRYESARALADDLGRWLGGKAILARPTALLEKVWLWVKRRPTIAGLGATGFGLLLTVAIGSTVAAFRIQRAHREAHRAEQAALREKTNAVEALWAALNAQARANRFSGQPGQRVDTLEAIRRAAEIRPSVQLRSEAIAALGVPDVGKLREVPFSGVDVLNICLDTALERYACRTNGREISVRRVADDVEVARLDGGGPAITWLGSFSPDGRHLLGATAQGFCLFSLSKQKPRLTGLGHADFSPDSRELAFLNPDGHIAIYGLEQQTVLRTIPSAYRSASLAYSPDGRRIACRQKDQIDQIDVWQITDGTLLTTLKAALPLDGFAWSPDERKLAAGDDDKAHVWHAESGEEKLVLRGHANRVVRLAFSHSGEFLARPVGTTPRAFGTSTPDGCC